jgi:hypothetical protein
VDVAFLALGSSPDQIRLEKAIIDGAVAAELPHLVKLSSIATTCVPQLRAVLGHDRGC